jgi:serine/threonine protein kinase
MSSYTNSKDSETSGSYDSKTSSSYNSSDELSLSVDDIKNHDENLNLEGTTINNYNILCELGKGSYSIVWLAYDIGTSKYVAIKVQDACDYKAGINENEFLKKIPKQLDYINHLITDFTEVQNNKKYLCSVYQLHCCDLDFVIRKTNYKIGLPENIVKNIIFQILNALYYLHSKLNVYHGDIKTDNILLKGTSKHISNIISLYDKMNFNEIYKKTKNEYNKKLSSSKKLKIKSHIHSEIYNKIKPKFINITKEIDDKYINNPLVCLADFGSFIENGEHYDESFGTRYYRSPENILIGKSSYPNDIWALGCVFYELLTGEILFDPNKSNQHKRDEYHLKLIEELCGPFDKHFLKTTKLATEYFNSKKKLYITENLDHKNKLENKLGINHKYLPLIKEMLKINPSDRITAKKAIELINKL